MANNPRRIGRYTLHNRLGRGGMGALYLAQDETLNRWVALKLLQADLDLPDARERFTREARAVAALNHPNIVTIHDFGEDDGSLFIVMEYIEGETLAEMIRRRAPMTDAQKLILLQELCAGVAYAHRAGIIHRDLKPANLMVDPNGALKILDFGIARMADSSMTKASALIGTPGYMSPEQIRGDAIDGRSDLFSTGAVAYELMSGREAFQGDTCHTIMNAVLQGDPPPLIDISPGIDPELDAIVRRAMAKDPADRYQGAEALQADFERVRSRLDPSTIEPLVTVRIDRSRTKHETDDVAEMLPTLVAARSESTHASLADRFNAWRYPIVIAAVTIVTVALAGILIGRGDAEAPSSRTSAPLRPRAVDQPSTPARDTSVPLRPATAPGGRVPDAPAHASVPPRPAEKAVASNVNPGRAGSDPAPPRVPSPPDTGLSDRPAAVGAMNLFYGRTSAAASTGGAPPVVAANTSGADAGRSALANTGLKYRVLQRLDTDKEEEVSPDTTFHSGDRVRFAFESNIDGYLYVIQQGSTGRWTVLFPSPRTNGGLNAIRRFQEQVVPPDTWFRFDANPGTEKVLVFLSREPVAQLPGFDRPVTKVEMLAQATVDDLAGSVRSRDLVFDTPSSAREGNADGQANQSTYVVNGDELGHGVVATIQLTHK